MSRDNKRFNDEKAVDELAKVATRLAKVVSGECFSSGHRGWQV